MPNPTATKPATAVWGSALTLGANQKAAVGLCEGAGSPVESVNNVVAMPATGYQAMQVGRAPVWVANGFNTSPTLRFPYQAQSLYFPGCVNSLGTARTFYAVLRLTTTLNLGAGYACYPVGAATDNFYHGMYLSDQVLGYFRTANSLLTGTTNLAKMSLIPGRWYAVAVAIDESTTPKTRLFYLYDYTAQALHGASGQGGTVEATATSVGSTNGLVINSCLQYAEYIQPFDLYCAGLDNAKWLAADFANFFADPSVFLRGTYTPSGGLVAGTSRLLESTESTIYVGSSRATGTGTGGSGAPTYQWYRATTSAFTPGAGNILANGGGVSGATTLNLTDGSVTAGTPYFYKLQAADGSSTVTFPQVSAITQAKAHIRIGQIGDSETRQQYHTVGFVRAIHARGRRASSVNAGTSGTSVSATTSWKPSYSPAAVNEVWTLSTTINGTPTGGTFTLTDPTSGITTGAINYNSTAAAMNTIMDTAFGVGFVVATGGPLPTAITLTFSGGTFASTSRALGYCTSSFTGTGTISGTTPLASITRTTAGTPGGTANNFLAVAQALFAADNVTWVVLQLGANDSSAGISQATFTTDLTAICSTLTGNGYKVVLLAPNYRVTAGLGSPGANPDATSETYVDAIRSYGVAMAGIANGSTILYGGTNGYLYSTTDFYDFQDGLHPLATIGQIMQGMTWATAAMNAIEPAAVGGGGTLINQGEY